MALSSLYCVVVFFFFFFFKQKTAYEMRISDWSSDVCSSDLDAALVDLVDEPQAIEVLVEQVHLGLHARRDPRGAPADVAGTHHHYAPRLHPGRAAEQHAATALEIGSAHGRTPVTNAHTDCRPPLEKKKQNNHNTNSKN